jgi:hypothetical protein
MALLWCSRSTDGPHDSNCDPLISYEGVITESSSIRSDNWVALTFVEDRSGRSSHIATETLICRTS